MVLEDFAFHFIHQTPIFAFGIAAIFSCHTSPYMSIQAGHTIRVAAGQHDDDTGIPIGGWSGRVIALHPETGMLEVEWDSPTLSQLPDAFILHSIDGGYDYFRYFIEAVDVEVIEPRDTPDQVIATQKALEAHYEEYELSGRRPPPFSAAEREVSSGAAAQTAHTTKKELTALLKTIEGSGSFLASGVRPFTHPGLQIEGVGEIGLPVTRGQAQDIIRQARQAPFGKGSRTITDTSVRKAWEIDAGQLSFHNKNWNSALQRILADVQQGLGIEAQPVKASLYKLLLYEEGGFFLPHQDSEKEKGMFATLVVGLPSTHSGGELLIRCDGREEQGDVARAGSNYQLPFAAFYADCEHEIKPVRSGYRLCLVYNLVQTAGAQRISSPQFGAQVGQMTRLLHALEDWIEWRPQAVLLDHQYTPANFSRDHLKLHDRPRAEAILEAAEKADYFATLGLVTLYRMGEWEDGYDHYYSRRRSRYYDYEEEETTGKEIMGDVYEEYTTVECWEETSIPGLGILDIREEDILADFELGKGDPIEKEAEGYTGNAGMTLQYWYHYGAVILWPRRAHAGLLKRLSVPEKLKWLDYYLRHWDYAGLNPRDYARQLLIDLKEETGGERERYAGVDFSPAAAAFAQLRDERFLKQHGEPLLSTFFDRITVDTWSSLVQHFQPGTLHPAFQKAGRSGDVFVLRHLLDILTALKDPGSGSLPPFALHQVQRLPDYLSRVQLHKLKEDHPFYFENSRPSRKEAITAIIEKVLTLSIHVEKVSDWNEKILEPLSYSSPRKYINEVLTPLLLSRKYNSSRLAKGLHQICLKDLKARTEVKPSPPTDWARKVPESSKYKAVWDILGAFLRSPTEQVFNYQANQSLRTEMERAVKSAGVDLAMQTIKKGRPYTLRLTKTQAAYERKLKKWEEDMALLEQLEQVGP